MDVGHCLGDVYQTVPHRALKPESYIKMSNNVFLRVAMFIIIWELIVWKQDIAIACLTTYIHLAIGVVCLQAFTGSLNARIKV